jgi:hypothetical protein
LLNYVVPFASFGKLSSPKTVKSNGIAQIGKPSSPKSAISNTFIDFMIEKNDTPTGSQSASPPFANNSNLSPEESVSEEESTGYFDEPKSFTKPLGASPIEHEIKSTNSPTLKDMIAAWNKAVAGTHSLKNDNAVSAVSPTEVAMLARFRKRLKTVKYESGQIFDLQGEACPVIVYTVENWVGLRSACSDINVPDTKIPRIEYFCDHDEIAFTLWLGVTTPELVGKLNFVSSNGPAIAS